uniref:Uncharacterized protein n=1 Tax=Rhizophora mucronata TaxID=61149 RepID=A0A2P2P7L7_RHIMU
MSHYMMRTASAIWFLIDFSEK